ncbi:MAG TPA: ribose-5-phosphate isomerase [Dermatophilaceae bacterium]|jgi:ribose 5-phosphate isomerase B|uniref:Ribose-5-phosphate isomerase B n=1 Tax=Candidatus Phosphoribacter hodrii TaxID=2953743 RepID=A0A934X5L9_9MICO|nr:ribose-5-phosphate isomerase [Candidatus Phosphoribacter hodrii]OPZ49529.1 MAG: Ribose-5-phosphate isomerase B [bacterium ADurb.BinA028]HNV15605.1 ribose-5-phosphate isomerase [Dermatophilaceae bacterium]MBL0002531.1 ribose-5-phosphate isomerase [Candidatus Phosphoribacter hodrii]HOA00784.1 ribose-5-phosphate isomerase [Dermatophilaceae bacterium]
MRVHLGGDHAAYALQRALVDHLTAAGHEVIDHGPLAYDAMDDYPVFVLRAAQAVAADPGSAGIVLGGSGNGEVMAANKVPGIRAAYAASIELAELAREHNDAQIISMGGRFTDIETGCAIADAFLATDFSGDERHARRLAMVSRFEADGSLPEG